MIYLWKEDKIENGKGKCLKERIFGLYQNTITTFQFYNKFE